MERIIRMDYGTVKRFYQEGDADSGRCSFEIVLWATPDMDEANDELFFRYTLVVAWRETDTEQVVLGTCSYIGCSTQRAFARFDSELREYLDEQFHAAEQEVGP